ncbi:MAG: ABC transporter substrate-binding protein [Chloroflexota bacterium]
MLDVRPLRSIRRDIKIAVIIPKVIFLLAIVLLVGVTGCSATQTSDSETGGTLTRAVASEPPTIDPQGPASSGLSLITPYIFDTLVTRQLDGNYVGILAESWQTSPDGKSIDIKLKSGIKFHDGSPLNASAVVFTFQRFKATGQKSPIAGSIMEIGSVEALDEMTVRFSFETPTASFLSTIAMPYAGIMSPSAVEAAGDEAGLKPVGTGPFKLGEWQRGVSITLLRNPEYRWAPPEIRNRGPVHIDKLVFKVVPDAGTQMSAIRAGDVDVIFVNDPGQVAALEKEQGLKTEPAGIDALVYLGYNCAKPPFDEIKVRQALSYAVNKDEIVKIALAGLGTVADTLLPPSFLGYDPGLKAYGQSYDPEKAKALLQESGFQQSSDGCWERDGKKLSGRLLTSTRAPNEAIATLLQSQFKAIGVPIEIQQLDSAAVMKATNEGAFDLLLWRYDWNDPNALNIYLSSSRLRQTNRVFYSNPTADALLEQGLYEQDPAKRSEIYKEAQKIILADAPWQPLYHPTEVMVFRNRVKGVAIGAMGRMLVNDVTLEGK